MSSVDLSPVSNHLEDITNVLVGYVYGSRATGRNSEDSDIDIGLVVSEDLSLKELNRLRRELEKITGLEVDLQVLNDSSPRFVYNVLRQGEPFYVGDESERISFEEKAMRTYLDMKPFLKEYDRYVKRDVTG